MDLTDEQWQVVKPLIPENPRRPGRSWQGTRRVLEANLWVLRTAFPWRSLPSAYPSYQTCHRRYLAWKRSGVWKAILAALAADLKDRGGLDLSSCTRDGTIIIENKAGILTITADPHLHGTWQLNTALIFLSPLLANQPDRLR